MIGYTFIKGRGQLHGYAFTASTAYLPYTAFWSSNPRAADTRGNRPVIEIQSAGFGELLLIYSQYVKDRGRDFGYTQYLHPVPAPSEADPPESAAFLSRSVPQLLFYPGFYSTDEFLAMDDNPAETRKTLDENYFPLPKVPEAAPVYCDDMLLGNLLADLWKTCYNRSRGDKTITPIRVIVSDERHPEETLEKSLVFMAKTVLPSLPLSVRAILSVTLGADWTNVGAYTGTACCIAQPNRLYDGVGYNIPYNLFTNRLSIEEKELGASLITGKHLEYYRQMETLMGVCPLCADFSIALYMVMLHKYLSMENRSTEDLNDCTRLWQYMDREIGERYTGLIDSRLRRQILMPIETDNLLLQANLSRENDIPISEYRGIVKSAFSMNSELNDGKVDLTRLREAYALCLAMPPRFIDAADQPYLLFLEDERYHSIVSDDPPLFSVSLALYLKTYGISVPLRNATLEAIRRRLTYLPVSDQAQIRTDVLQPYALDCLRAGQPMRSINALCMAFGLDGAALKSEVLVNFHALLSSSGRADEEAADYLSFIRLADSPEISGLLFDQMDDYFRTNTANMDTLKRYMGLCESVEHIDSVSLGLVCDSLTRLRSDSPLSETEFSLLTAFCKRVPDEQAAEACLWRYYASMSLHPRSCSPMNTQMTEIVTKYPRILNITEPASDNWDYFRVEKIIDGLKTALKKLSIWEDFVTLSARWITLSELPYLKIEDWKRLPDMTDIERLGESLTEKYQAMFKANPLTLKSADDKLQFIGGEPDWLKQMLTPLVLQELSDALPALWLNIRNISDTYPLRSLMNQASVKTEQYLKALKEESPAPQQTPKNPADLNSLESLQKCFQDPQLIQAINVLQNVNAFIDRHQNLISNPDPSVYTEAAALIQNISHCAEAAHITEVLKNQYNEKIPRMSFYIRLIVCCLISVNVSTGSVIDWERMLNLLNLNMETVLLEHINPWVPSGGPVFRTLLLTFRVCDQLFTADEARTLGYYLQQKYPRLTRAVQRKRNHREYLRCLYDANNTLDSDLALEWCGRSAMKWIFSKS